MLMFPLLFFSFPLPLQLSRNMERIQQPNQMIQGAKNPNPIPYRAQNVSLATPILGPQLPLPRITPMNLVMVEEMS